MLNVRSRGEQRIECFKLVQMLKAKSAFAMLESSQRLSTEDRRKTTYLGRVVIRRTQCSAVRNQRWYARSALETPVTMLWLIPQWQMYQWWALTMIVKWWASTMLETLQASRTRVLEECRKSEVTSQMAAPCTLALATTSRSKEVATMLAKTWTIRWPVCQTCQWVIFNALRATLWLITAWPLLAMIRWPVSLKFL